MVVHHSGQLFAKANGIELCYDTFGDLHARPLVLIMGLASQMVMWEDEFCKKLAEKDYYVIRLDNRDVGMSARLDNAGVPNVMALIEGKDVTIPYTLRDMADDAAGLLDTLKIPSAHIVGASMGGMIAQNLTIHYPDRVKTLTSIMSSTNDPTLPPPRPGAFSVLFKPFPLEKNAYIETFINIWTVLSGPHYPFAHDRIMELAELTYSRGVNPKGAARQLAAILASKSRRQNLQSVKTQSLVIHGDADPLVPVECGIDTAKNIPGANLLILSGMGHSVPGELWPQIIDAIAKHAV
jgi:pimeloyl-ACP methyl ester carboxylesterase